MMGRLAHILNAKLGLSASLLVVDMLMVPCDKSSHPLEFKITSTDMLLSRQLEHVDG
jgi:hypothetical protein